MVVKMNGVAYDCDPIRINGSINWIFGTKEMFGEHGFYQYLLRDSKLAKAWYDAKNTEQLGTVNLREPAIVEPTECDNVEVIDNVHFDGYVGTWYAIGMKHYEGRDYYLMESEYYGDEAAWMIVDQKMRIIEDEAWNGFADLEYLNDKGD